MARLILVLKSASHKLSFEPNATAIDVQDSCDWGKSCHFTVRDKRTMHSANAFDICGYSWLFFGTGFELLK